MEQNRFRIIALSAVFLIIGIVIGYSFGYAAGIHRAVNLALRLINEPDLLNKVERARELLPQVTKIICTGR